MSSGLELEEPDYIRARTAKPAVERERGKMEYADTYFLAKLIMWGNKDEKLVAGKEWKRRTSKPFPYHPSFEGDKYPLENLKGNQ